jgi:hypothetical protein
MPYQLAFTHPVVIGNRADYINECCIGGDIVLDQLLPALRERYGDVAADEEDWGWFAWFDEGNVRLAVDVFTDDPEAGAFRIHLTSRTRRLLVVAKAVDTPELDVLRDIVVDALAAWIGSRPAVTRIERD